MSQKMHEPFYLYFFQSYGDTRSLVGYVASRQGESIPDLSFFAYM